MEDFDYAKHVSIEVGFAQLDHIAALADLTGTEAADWAEVDGPDSRVGVSYWYSHEARRVIVGRAR